MRTLGWFSFWFFLFATLVFGAPRLIQMGGSAYIRDQIQQFGLQNAEIKSIHLGLSGFTLSNIKLDQNASNTIGEINGTYELWPLIRGERQLKSLTLKDVALAGTIDREAPKAPYGLTFPFWPKRFTLNTFNNKEDTTNGFQIPSLPFQKLNIENATIRIITERAPLEFIMNGVMSDEAAPDRILSGEFTIKAKDRDLDFQTDGKLKLSVAAQTLEGLFHIAPNTYDISTFQSQYSGLMPPILQKGTVDISGDISVKKEGAAPITVSGPLKIKLNNIAGQADDIVLDKLSSDIEIKDILPELVGSANDVRIRSATLNETEFSTIRAHGQISAVPANPILTMKDLSAHVYDGTISSPRIVYALRDGLKENIKLHFSKFDLAELIHLLDINGLSGKGQFSGDMTVAKNGKIILINQGHIANLEDGYISYLPSEYPAALSGNDTRLQTVRDALTDFRFHDLQADISGPVSGDLKVSLKAKGTNKKLFDDRPIHFNLNLEGPLAPLAKSFFQPLSLRGEGSR